jgi:hypothetical protein
MVLTNKVQSYTCPISETNGVIQEIYINNLGSSGYPNSLTISNNIILSRSLLSVRILDREVQPFSFGSRIVYAYRPGPGLLFLTMFQVIFVIICIIPL